MLVQLSVVLLLGALVYVMWRYQQLRPWHAIVCALFGFYIASTSAAPYIREGMRSLVELLSGVNFGI